MKCYIEDFNDICKIVKSTEVKLIMTGHIRFKNTPAENECLKLISEYDNIDIVDLEVFNKITTEDFEPVRDFIKPREMTGREYMELEL